MFEYHGWITLRQTAAVVDDEPQLRLSEIQALVDEFAGYALADLQPMNGTYYIHLGGNPNRRGQHGGAVVELFAEVGRLAPGSYGLLYVHDDEHPEHMVDFRVFRLVRGAVTEHADHLLSPVIPTLEDEDVNWSRRPHGRRSR
ncbi:Imm7 family immunity protein [Amycolatopsis sp. NPDC051371]|uniref:Imm7 family immunity protein n=1 Tax=Amycolatopsis sp. NPDC051371 TaxID=3155800 RepID=UPI00344A2C35